jgi:hypothetical protein
MLKYKTRKNFLTNILLFILLNLNLFLNLSCNTTEPTDTNGIDTTSHNFTFQTWTFGEHSSSILYDVTIIDENNIWAVGEIYMNDTLGQPDPQPYSVAHWDGSDWTIIKVPYHDFNQTVKHPGPLFTIAVIESEIYVVSYANLLKWTGSDWEEKAFFMEQIPFDGQVSKMWGIDENNIYCVGRNGAIYFYFGSDWQKIESGSELDIYDIVGKQNINNLYEVICVAAKQSVNSSKKIYRIENNILTELNVNGIPSSIRGIWFKPGEKYYVVGSGMFYKNNINSNDNWISFGKTVTPFYTNAIDGNDLNDIVVCGAYGELLHYNGSSWKSYQDQLEMQAGSYRSIKIKNNFLIAVGYDSPKAVITIGKRE